MSWLYRGLPGRSDVNRMSFHFLDFLLLLAERFAGPGDAAFFFGDGDLAWGSALVSALATRDEVLELLAGAANFLPLPPRLRRPGVKKTK